MSKATTSKSLTIRDLMDEVSKEKQTSQTLAIRISGPIRDHYNQLKTRYEMGDTQLIKTAIELLYRKSIADDGEY